MQFDREAGQAMKQSIIVEIDGKPFETSLRDDIAPHTCHALLATLPIKGEIIHAMWSGPLCLMLDVNLGVPLENPVSFLSTGDLIYHPFHHEIGVAYGPTQFREPTGNAYVTFLGKLSGDLSHVQQVGSRLQRTGARPFGLR